MRHLEAQRPPAEWAGPLPIVCPQDWPAADFAAWDAARAVGDEVAMDQLIERHAGAPSLPLQAGIRCIVIHHLPPRGDEAWDG
ncbi:MAG: hypothetical protein ACRDJW_22875 [Thermomicrobiales bacterium]